MEYGRTWGFAFDIYWRLGIQEKIHTWSQFGPLSIVWFSHKFEICKISTLYRYLGNFYVLFKWNMSTTKVTVLRYPEWNNKTDV